MGGIASQGQLRMSLVRWAAVTIPLLLLLGFLSGASVPAGRNNAWYVALAKPAANPPDWVFPVAWTILYALLGLALAAILNARGARGRGVAIAVFAAGFAVSLAFQPVFFGAHRIDAALGVIAGMLALGVIATLLFGRIRTGAAWLMVPYLVWVSFAGALTWRIGQLNPDAAALAPGSRTTQML